MNEQQSTQPFLNRPYQGPADTQAILDLVRARPIERARDYPTSADLLEQLAIPSIQATTRVWETPAGRLAGYALLEHFETYADLAFEYLDEFSNSAIADEMVTWGEQAYRDCYPLGDADFSSVVQEGQPERKALLERHGFQLSPESVVVMFRPLDEPITPPTLPTGFAIRTLQGEAEVPTWVSLHRAAFGTNVMTEEYRLAMMRVPDYDPGLDLVMTAPDETPVAYLFGAIHKEENKSTGLEIGYPDTAGTHPRYRGRGLAQALLLEFLLRIKQRGMKAGCLHTSSENIAMQRAAIAAGFHLTGRFYHYVKVREASQPG